MDNAASTATGSGKQPASCGALPVLKPGKPPKPPYARPIEVGLRSVHIVSMAMVLGGIPMGGTFATLRVPIVATLASGFLLLATCMRWGCFNLSQGAGWALLLKLGFVGLGNLVGGARLPCYVVATLIASVGSHMPSSWRHFSLRARDLSPQPRSRTKAA
jgi:hypothetical protein